MPVAINNLVVTDDVYQRFVTASKPLVEPLGRCVGGRLVNTASPDDRIDVVQAFAQPGDRTIERLNNVDAIVWTSSVNQPPSNAATRWFNQWFARGDKTLVYIVRDHQIVDRYWHQAAKLAEPEQRLEYR